MEEKLCEHRFIVDAIESCGILGLDKRLTMHCEKCGEVIQKSSYKQKKLKEDKDDRKDDKNNEQTKHKNKEK